ncbi:hypothetical protein [Thiohalorhabdus methylotrophus]|uniref:Uncharacterized protein n=1 Tax=Thiohalorhabdus methylotrophus TaxID=3242694 RepID=A0ABV4TYR0_9GAMM
MEGWHVVALINLVVVLYLTIQALFIPDLSLTVLGGILLLGILWSVRDTRRTPEPGQGTTPGSSYTKTE